MGIEVQTGYKFYLAGVYQILFLLFLSSCKENIGLKNKLSGKCWKNI